MVKAYNRPGIRVTKRFTNVMHTAILTGGRVVYKKWPKKRGKTKPGAVADMRKMFGWAASQSVLAIPEDKIFAETITKGSMYYPRDALISAMYGTLISIRNADGTTLWSRRMADRNIQAMLDTISNTPGAMLMRGGDEWVALLPGVADYVLQSNGPGFVPSWTPQSGGGGGGAQDFWAGVGNNNGPDFTGKNYKGAIFLNYVDTTIAQVWALLNPAGARNYHSEIWSLGATTLDALLGQSETVAVAHAADQSTFFKYDIPVVIPAGQKFAIFLMEEGQSPTNGWGSYYGTGFATGAPGKNYGYNCTVAATVAAPGDTFGLSSNFYTLSYTATPAA